MGWFNDGSQKSLHKTTTKNSMASIYDRSEIFASILNVFPAVASADGFSRFTRCILSIENNAIYLHNTNMPQRIHSNIASYNIRATHGEQFAQATTHEWTYNSNDSPSLEVSLMAGPASLSVMVALVSSVIFIVALSVALRAVVMLRIGVDEILCEWKRQAGQRQAGAIRNGNGQRQ